MTVDPPTYPKHCPMCAAVVSPLHITKAYSKPLPPEDAWEWLWIARCWNGHLVQPEAAQMALFDL